MTKTFSLKLPANYRQREVLSFHARDKEAIAEQVETDRMRRGFMVDGLPTVLDISLKGDSARCRIIVDGELPETSLTEMRRAARGVLALTIDPEPFELATKADKIFSPLVLKKSGLRIPQVTTPFEAIIWAIIGQQINVSFATVLRRQLILMAGKQHSSGLWCFPDAAAVAGLTVDQLRARQFSGAKADAVLRVAHLVASEELPLVQWLEHLPPDVHDRLLAIKGIGPWTVNYTLLRGFGHPDCSLHGDAAIKAALHRLSGAKQKLEAKYAETFLERYKPYRSMAAAHLWASLS